MSYYWESCLSFTIFLDMVVSKPVQGSTPVAEQLTAHATCAPGSIPARSLCYMLSSLSLSVLCSAHTSESETDLMPRKCNYL